MAKTEKNLVELVDEIDGLVEELDNLFDDKAAELLMVARVIGAEEFRRVVAFLGNR